MFKIHQNVGLKSDIDLQRFSKNWIHYYEEKNLRSNYQISDLKALAHLLSYSGRLEEAKSYYKQINYEQNKQKYEAKGYNSLEIIRQNQSARKPKFIIIGAGKAGSTSLYHWITSHPDVLQAVEKEVSFFRTSLSYYDLGEDWYESQFPDIPENSHFITGEATPWYLFEPDVANRVFQFQPSARLIVLLRNPAVRAFSQYNMFYRHGLECRDFSTIVSSEKEHLNSVDLSYPYNFYNLSEDYWKYEMGYLMYGLYASLLAPWLQFFLREQILFIKSENLFTNTESTLNDVFRFLELPEFTLSKYKTYNKGQYNSVDSRTIQVLHDFYRPHNQKLEEMLGINFNWD